MMKELIAGSHSELRTVYLIRQCFDTRPSTAGDPAPARRQGASVIARNGDAQLRSEKNAQA
jgi:hypothetical protein